MTDVNRQTTYLDDLIEDYISPPDDPDSRKFALEMLRAWQLALETKDLPALESMMHDDIVIDLPFSESGRVEPGFYRVFQGIPACIEFWRTAFSFEKVMHPFSEMELTVNADGSRLFLEACGHVTMTSNVEYRNRYVLRVDFADRKVRGYREYYNPIISAHAFGRLIAGQFKVEKL
ncbi:MAG: nuclear transport factor 2 family protein [Sphingorhabdus sp.]